MRNVPKQFAFKFLLLTILFMRYSGAEIYLGSGTLEYVRVNDARYFNYSEKLPNKVITYADTDAPSLKDELEVIEVHGFINGQKDEHVIAHGDLCTLLQYSNVLRADYNLGFIITKHLLPLSRRCPLSKGSYLIPDGFTRLFELPKKYAIPCHKDSLYSVFMKRGDTGEQIMEAAFKIKLAPMYACEKLHKRMATAPI